MVSLVVTEEELEMEVVPAEEEHQVLQAVVVPVDRFG